MTILNIHEIKTSFSHYARLVMRGKSFVIAIRNKPFAKLVPLEATDRPRQIKFGVLTQRVEIPADFNAPLEGFERDFYSGG